MSASGPLIVFLRGMGVEMDKSRRLSPVVSIKCGCRGLVHVLDTRVKL